MTNFFQDGQRLLQVGLGKVDLTPGHVKISMALGLLFHIEKIVIPPGLLPEK